MLFIQKTMEKQRQQNLWKSEMNPERREQDRKDLFNLQDRVAFLKNPRHIPPSACSSMLVKTYLTAENIMRF